jgi:hypothetical protein
MWQPSGLFIAGVKSSYSWVGVMLPLYDQIQTRDLDASGIELYPFQIKTFNESVDYLYL